MNSAATTVAPQRELQIATPAAAAAPPEPHPDLHIAPRDVATWLALSVVGWSAAFAGWWLLTATI